MALIDKLNEEQANEELRSQTEKLENLKGLLEQTMDLNDLMRSYIRTSMDKEAAEKMTLDNEIDKIKSTSKQIMAEMHLILEKQEKALLGSAEVLQEAMTESQNEIQKNNALTLKKMAEIENDLKKGMAEINRDAKSILSEIALESRTMVMNARKGVLINGWLDVAKYGLVSLMFNLLLFLGLYYFFVK